MSLFATKYRQLKNIIIMCKYVHVNNKNSFTFRLTVKLYKLKNLALCYEMSVIYLLSVCNGRIVANR